MIVVRDALARDCFGLTRLLAAAVADSPLGRCMDPNADSRPDASQAFVGEVIEHAMASGIVRLAERGGVMVGAALWSIRPAGGVAALPDSGVTHDLGSVDIRRRRVLLERFTASRCPDGVAFHRLALLGVHPDVQGQGVGSYLLNMHHRLLNSVNSSAFTVGVGDRVLELLERHDYTTIGPAQALPGGVPMSALWRSPRPADLS